MYFGLMCCGLVWALSEHVLLYTALDVDTLHCVQFSSAAGTDVVY